MAFLLLYDTLAHQILLKSEGIKLKILPPCVLLPKKLRNYVEHIVGIDVDASGFGKYMFSSCSTPSLLLEPSGNCFFYINYYRKYLRDSEREQLCRQALTLALQALRAKLREGPVTSGLVVDMYRAYLRVQRHLPQKESVFASLLSEAYKQHAKVCFVQNHSFKMNQSFFLNKSAAQIFTLVAAFSICVLPVLIKFCSSTMRLNV